MKIQKSYLLHVLAGSVGLAIALIVVPLVLAGPGRRPFWTEKSTFIEGDDLFVVGVASNAKSMEEGRRQAFENGKVELMNFAQVTNLEAQGLVIETRVTYEESNSDGTVNVFRLLRVSATKLAAIQGRLQTQSRAQEETLEQTRRELAAVQDSLTRKQQDSESRARTMEATLQAVSQLQVMLGGENVLVARCRSGIASRDLINTSMPRSQRFKRCVGTTKVREERKTECAIRHLPGETKCVIPPLRK